MFEILRSSLKFEIKQLRINNEIKQLTIIICSFFKVAFLPYALSLDNWRYDIFSGNVNKRIMNCHYWNLR